MGSVAMIMLQWDHDFIEVDFGGKGLLQNLAFYCKGENLC